MAGSDRRWWHEPEGRERLESLLRRINRGRIDRASIDRAPAENRLDEEWEEDLDLPSCQLAVYGTLAPGRRNHHLLSGLGGTWTEGVVRGRFSERGWGWTSGFPALIWDPSAPPVVVHRLRCDELRRCWNRLDEFEGEEYVRILVPVEEPTRRIAAVANLYQIRDLEGPLRSIEGGEEVER